MVCVGTGASPVMAHLLVRFMNTAKRVVTCLAGETVGNDPQSADARVSTTLYDANMLPSRCKP